MRTAWTYKKERNVCSLGVLVSCVDEDKHQLSKRGYLSLWQHFSVPVLCQDFHRAKNHFNFSMDGFGFEKEEIILNIAVSNWSKGMKHIMTVYGQVKLTALCILNFFSWL